MTLVANISGEEVSEVHAKSVLISILDPVTRQHTAMSQGVNTSFQMLKKIVMEFASNAGGGEAMQIGSFGRTNAERYDYEKGAWLHAEASGRGMTQGGWWLVVTVTHATHWGKAARNATTAAVSAILLESARRKEKVKAKARMRKDLENLEEKLALQT